MNEQRNKWEISEISKKVNELKNRWKEIKPVKKVENETNER